MPDITMCNGTDCPMKVNCYRFTATPTPGRQSYFVESPIEPDFLCVYFWPNDTLKEKKNDRNP